MNFEIRGLPAFGAIAHLAGRVEGRPGNPGKIKYVDIIEMRRLYTEEKMKVVDIARQFGISRANASSIIHGYSWKSQDVVL